VVDRIKSSLVETVYNGIDIADWDTVSMPPKVPGAFVVATVGNIRRVKGHDIFIKAAACVAAQFPGVSFNIAGEVLEPDYFVELQTLIRDLKLSDRFHFVGGVKNLREYLSTADIFVLPSRSEGFSNAIVEAMAASLPVVATDVGGNTEAVTDGVSGLIVPSEDPAALAEAITQLLADPSKAREMGAAGKKLASEKFTTDAMMHQITLAYASLLTRPAPPSASDRDRP
jgi:glycosyltransferase involved in cell wall biosynthesis